MQNLASSSSFLERSLSPLWKLTYYSGFLFDWCRPIHTSRISAIVHWIIITLSFNILIYKIANFTCQMILTMMDVNASFQHAIGFLVPLSNLPLIIFTWTRYLLRRVKFLAFFRDWKIMEDHQLSSSTISDDVLNIKKVCFIINVLYASFGFCFFFSFLVTLVIAPRSLGNELIFSYFSRLKETSWAILFHFFTFMSFLFMVVFLTIVDVVPVMVYFHAAKMIEALKIRLESRLNENQVNNYEAIHPIWSHFEIYKITVLWLVF